MLSRAPKHDERFWRSLLWHLSAKKGSIGPRPQAMGNVCATRGGFKYIFRHRRRIGVASKIGHSWRACECLGDITLDLLRNTLYGLRIKKARNANETRTTVNSLQAPVRPPELRASTAKCNYDLTSQIASSCKISEGICGVQIRVRVRVQHEHGMSTGACKGRGRRCGCKCAQLMLAS